jgi:hypothetical protein
VPLFCQRATVLSACHCSVSVPLFCQRATVRSVCHCPVSLPLVLSVCHKSCQYLIRLADASPAQPVRSVKHMSCLFATCPTGRSPVLSTISLFKVPPALAMCHQSCQCIVSLSVHHYSSPASSTKIHHQSCQSTNSTGSDKAPPFLSVYHQSCRCTTTPVNVPTTNKPRLRAFRPVSAPPVLSDYQQQGQGTIIPVSMSSVLSVHHQSRQCANKPCPHATSPVQVHHHSFHTSCQANCSPVIDPEKQEKRRNRLELCDPGKQVGRNE